MCAANYPISRRSVLGGLLGGLAAAALPHRAAARSLQEPEKAVKKGRLKQSLCHWCMRMPLPELAPLAARLGVPSIEILTSKDFPVLKEHGLICAMTMLKGRNVIGRGLNRVEHHEEYTAMMRQAIDDTADAGFPNVICFSGNREGMDDDEGMRHCATGIKEVLGHAEKRGITLCMELLNSKEHKDYMCDRTTWGVELVQQVGSERFRLLYDIYHMQRMEGDVINTIRQHKDYIAHYHTAGNPGRSNLDDTQELQYGPICQAIVDSGYQGYLGQEFIPKGGEDAIRQAVELCDV